MKIEQRFPQFKNYKKRLRSFITHWFMPQGLRNIAIVVRNWYVYKNQITKTWRYEPVRSNLHDSELLEKHAKGRAWISLEKELRIGYILRKTTTFQLNAPAQSRIQFGIGTPRPDLADVKIYLNGQEKISLTNMDQETWNNVQLDVDGSSELKIEMPRGNKIYFSDPVRIKKVDKPKNIICIFMDSMTPELVNPTDTPHICSFFEAGQTCTQAYAQSDWTLPTFGSMLTGVYPSKHGAVYNSVMKEQFPTLPNFLREAGYRTYTYSNALRYSPAYGHAKGYERFLFYPHILDVPINKGFTGVHKTIQHLEAHKDESNFVVLDIVDTHKPFKPFGYLADAYEAKGLTKQQAKIKDIDLLLKTFFSYLEEQPWFDDAVIICSADHGQNLFPDGPEGKKRHLHDDAVAVPFLVRGPSIEPGVCEDLLECSVDLMPSILKMAGIKCPSSIDGRPWPFLDEEKREEAYSECLIDEDFEASFRDQDRSYHFKCGYNKEIPEIDLANEEPILVYKRKNGKIVYEEQEISDEQRAQLRSKFLDRIRGYVYK